jgi:hypothetical protein
MLKVIVVLHAIPLDADLFWSEAVFRPAPLEDVVVAVIPKTGYAIAK